MSVVNQTVRMSRAGSRLDPHIIFSGSFVTERLKPGLGDGIRVYYRYAVFLCHLENRFRVVPVTVFLQLSFIVEPSARHRSEKDRLRALFQCIIYECPEILLIGPESRSVPGRVIFLGIIVAELDEKIFSWFQVSFHLVPQTAVYKAFRAAAVLGIVAHCHHGIQMRRKPLAPSPLRISFRKILVSHGGITHQPQGDFLSVLLTGGLYAESQEKRHD